MKTTMTRMMTYQIQTSPATLMAVQGMMSWSKEGALPPQRLAGPALGEAHGGGIHRGVLRQQGLQVGGEGVLRVDAMQQIGGLRDSGRWKRHRSVTEGSTVGSTPGCWVLVGASTLKGSPNGELVSNAEGLLRIFHSPAVSNKKSHRVGCSAGSWWELSKVRISSALVRCSTGSAGGV